MSAIQYHRDFGCSNSTATRRAPFKKRQQAQPFEGLAEIVCILWFQKAQTADKIGPFLPNPEPT